MIKMNRLSPRSSSKWSQFHQVTSYSCIFLLLLTMLSGFVGSCYLNQSNSSLGWTYPSGDIILHVGEPLELFCSINLEIAGAKIYTVDNLVFYRDKDPVDPNYVSKINETTIRLYVENKEESDHMYSCYLIASKRTKSHSTASSSSCNGGGSISSLGLSSSNDIFALKDFVCMNMVAVGSKPKEVENVTCVSFNYQELKCTWDVPKNYVPTNYTIKYIPKHRNQREAAACPNDDDIKNNSCTWTLTTKPPYRKIFEHLQINITGLNKFNRTEQIINFHHFAHIIPEGPKDLQLLNKTATSIKLQWNIGELQFFPKNWTYKILYMCNNTNWMTFMCDSKNFTRNNGIVSCDVPNLIPNMFYNFRVYIKSSLAIDKYWSEKFASQVFRTKACPPARSPETDVGSFQIEESSSQSFRTVYLYWKPLQTTEYYGDNFHYKIEVFLVDESGKESPAADIKCESLNFSFAKYEIGSSAYKFCIRSANAEGVAPTASLVSVPSVINQVDKCSSFSKTDYGNNMYEVSWQPPLSTWNILNYTVFWCQTEKERPFQCDGFTEWIHIPANYTKHNFSINSTNSYQLAISVNTQSSSSGMLWATCTVLHGHLGTIKQVYASQVSATSIQVAWKLECWDPVSTIKGFLASYCPIPAQNDTKCSGPKQNVRWMGNVHRSTGNLANLQPYTYYKVSLQMYSAERNGAPSPSVIFRTSDGAPMVDHLRTWVVQRTNVSVSLKWEVPKVTNGILRWYKVRYHRKHVEPIDDGIIVKSPDITISNLLPYTSYNVSVLACTSLCSKPMPSIIFRTRIGIPDVPAIESSLDLKSPDGGEVWWNPPARLAGPNPYYELLVLKDSKVVMLKNVTNTTRTQVATLECTGENGAGFYSLKVRAINVDDGEDESNEPSALSTLPQPSSSPLPAASSPLIHVGPWSSVYAQNCNFGGMGAAWKVVGCILIPLFFGVIFFVGGRKGLLKCRQMKSVQVMLPMKFSLSTTSVLSESRGHDLFTNYSIVLPFGPTDEFSNQVDQTTEQTV